MNQLGGAQFDARMVSHIHYNKPDKDTRAKSDYETIRNQLEKVTLVEKYKTDLLEIDLTCKRGKQNVYQIMEPICFEKCKHEVFDLYELFTDKPRIPCSKCKLQPSKDNLKIIRKEQFYGDILKNINELAYSCSLIEQQVFHSYAKGVQDRARALLGKKEYLAALKEAMGRKNDMGPFFASQVQKILHIQNAKSIIQTHKIIEQPFVCLINCQKIIIPAYFEGCNHIECYEYTNLLQLIDTSQEKEIKCFHENCENIIPLELALFKKKIIIPLQLATAITKEHPFALTIKWNYQKSCFDDSKSQAWDVFRKDISDQLQKDELSQDILIKFKKIVNQEHSENLDNKLRFSQYHLNLKGIEYPARCNQCQLQNCKDLKTFLESEIRDMKNNQFICPACNYWHSNKKLEEIVYLDRYLYCAKSHVQDLQPFKYNEQDQFKNYFMKQHQLKFKNVKLKYLADNINPYPSDLCSISKSRITDPVVIQGCQKKRCFEFQNFKKILNEIEFDLSQFPKCGCSFCDNGLRLKDFSYDFFFKTILMWLSPDKDWVGNVEKVIQKNFASNPTDFTEPEKPKILLQQKSLTNSQISDQSGNITPGLQRVESQNLIQQEQQNFQNQIPQYQPPQYYYNQPTQQQQRPSIKVDETVYVSHNGMLIPEAHYNQIIKNK